MQHDGLKRLGINNFSTMVCRACKPISNYTGLNQFSVINMEVTVGTKFRPFWNTPKSKAFIELRPGGSKDCHGVCENTARVSGSPLWENDSYVVQFQRVPRFNHGSVKLFNNKSCVQPKRACLLVFLICRVPSKAWCQWESAQDFGSFRRHSFEVQCGPVA